MEYGSSAHTSLCLNGENIIMTNLTLHINEAVSE